jgi:hypothetical protein
VNTVILPSNFIKGLVFLAGMLFYVGDTRISNIEQHTSQKEETINNNRRKKRTSTAYSSLIN